MCYTDDTEKLILKKGSRRSAGCSSHKQRHESRRKPRQLITLLFSFFSSITPSFLSSLYSPLILSYLILSFLPPPQPCYLSCLLLYYFGTTWQSTTPHTILSAVIYGLKVLEARSPRSRCWPMGLVFAGGCVGDCVLLYCLASHDYSLEIYIFSIPGL